MTAPETTEPVFRCDCIAEKKRAQAINYQVTKDMTDVERREYRRKNSEEFRAEVARIRAERKVAGEDVQ
jgi:hypothetical protein